MNRVLRTLLAAGVLLAACAAVGAQVKLAVLAPLSGSVPSFGQSTKEGALLAIAEWNKKGGVLGQKITAIVEDSQCAPDPAVNAANKVINQDKVKFIIGEVCSSATIPVSEIANAAKVVEISSASTNTNVTLDKNGKTKDYIFRACYIDPFQGSILGRFAYTTLKATKAFIMYDQGNDYTIGLADAFEKQYKSMGGAIAGKETYTKSDTDFSAILAKVKNSGAQVVLLPDYYNIVNLVTEQAKRLGITVPFIGGDGWDSPDLEPQFVSGSYFTNHYSKDDPRPLVQNFLKAYAAAYKGKVPDALAVLAYDATNLMLQGMVNAKSTTDTTAIKNALEKINFEAVSGKITYDAQHNPVKALTILKVTPDGVKFDSVVQP